MSFVFKLKKPWIPRSSRGMTFLSACFFVIPAEAGIQTFFSSDVLQSFYERTKSFQDYKYCETPKFNALPIDSAHLNIYKSLIFM